MNKRITIKNEDDNDYSRNIPSGYGTSSPMTK